MPVCTSKYVAAQPWKNTTGPRVAALAGAFRFFSQPCSVCVWAGGIGASRWMPMTFSTIVRMPLLCRAALASGATGVIIMPISVVRVISWSRTGMWSAFITARAWLFSSAIWTPCGQARVQMPQDEQ
jgi:hypothetical protein